MVSGTQHTIDYLLRVWMSLQMSKNQLGDHSMSPNDWSKQSAIHSSMLVLAGIGIEAQPLSLLFLLRVVCVPCGR